MRMVAFGVAPYVMFDGRNVRGVDVDIMALMARKFGFTFQVAWDR